MNLEEEKKKRRRLFDVLLYDEQFVDVVDNAMHLKNLRWYWSYHDKDVKEDGTSKDPHYHLLLYFDEAISLSSLKKKIKFDREDRINIYPSGSDEGRLDYRIRYLIHYKSKTKDKFEYSIEDIHTNDDEYQKFFNEDTSKQKQDIALIFDFFDSHSSFISYRTFLNYIYANNLWPTFRQNAFIFNRLFDEHNNDLTEQRLSIFK